MKNLLFIVSIPFLLACGPEQQRKPMTGQEVPVEKPKPLPFHAGGIIASISLESDSSQSYALYLPNGYTDTGHYPVIVFFDPRGEGATPLKLYSSLADEYHFILAGSNSSRNGLDIRSSGNIAGSLLSEVLHRFSVDPTKVALCGFSGGAKVALTAGATDPRVSTILYCGAAAQVQASHPVALLGFAGTSDMNYTDLVSFEWSLKNAPVPHYLVQWKGAHAFPDAAVFRDAFTFMRSGTIENYPAKQVTITEQQVNEEQALKQKYLSAFSTAFSPGWWQEEIRMLNKKKKTSPMHGRLLGFISLACYSIVSNAIQQNDFRSAEAILSVYKMADPDNKAIKEFASRLDAQKKKAQ